MNEGALRLVQAMGFSPEQLDLVDRVVSLEQEDFVRFVKVDSYSDLLSDYGPILPDNQPRKIRMNVGLTPGLRRRKHETVMKMVREAVVKRGFQPDDVFSYCSHSYGIELGNFEVGIGPQYRQ